MKRKKIKCKLRKARFVRASRVHYKIRSQCLKTAKFRMSAFVSNKHISVQIIDDSKGITLASTSTKQLLAGEGKSKKNLANRESAKVVGEKIAKLAIDVGVNEVVFDRGAKVFHKNGKLDALVTAAREGGLKI